MRTVLLATAALVAVSIVPAPAQAGNDVGAFIGGAILGGIIGATQPRSYAPPPGYVACKNVQVLVGYDQYGQPVYQYQQRCW